MSDKPTKGVTTWRTEHPVPVGWMRQFRYFVEQYSKIQNLSGDVVECGLGEGNTFAMLAYFIGSEETGPKRTLWGFDSFEGFPEPTALDASPRNPKKGEWKVSENMVRERFAKSGIDEEFPQLDIKIVKGFLGETLPKFPDRSIAFLHIDVDIYVGYRDALQHLFPKVVPGGMVLFDEYREYHPEFPEYGDKEKWPGCTKAVDEYFKDRPEKIQYHPESKKYYVVKSS